MACVDLGAGRAWHRRLDSFGIQPEAKEFISFPLDSQAWDGNRIVHGSTWCQAEHEPPVDANAVSILEVLLDLISVKW